MGIKLPSRNPLDRPGLLVIPGDGSDSREACAACGSHEPRHREVRGGIEMLLCTNAMPCMIRVRSTPR